VGTEQSAGADATGRQEGAGAGGGEQEGAGGTTGLQEPVVGSMVFVVKRGGVVRVGCEEPRENGEPGFTVIIEKSDSLNPGMAVKCSRSRITLIRTNPRKIKRRFNHFVILINDFLLSYP